MWDILFFFFIVVPLVHLIHESGHVLVAKLFRVSGTQIVIGVGRSIGNITISDTIIKCNLIPFLGGYSTNDKEGHLTYGQQACISIGGPMLNFLSIIVVLPFLNVFTHFLIDFFIYFSLWIGIVNLIPFKVGDKKSDGWQIAASVIKLVRRN